MCNLFKALKSISLQIISLIHQLNQLNQRVLGILGGEVTHRNTQTGDKVYPYSRAYGSLRLN